MTDLPPLRPHPHLYEINTWVWLEELSRREGRMVTLGRVRDEEWDRLQAMGIDLVWLMGVWRRSPEGRRIAQTDPTLFTGYAAALPGWQPDDVVGSPYAVQAYEPDPRVGTWKELEAARATLHRRGMRLVLDFVPNHTARDHAWVVEHPEYYVQGAEGDAAARPSEFFQTHPGGQRRWLAHGRDPYFPAWSDSAQLHVFHPGTRTALVGELRRVARFCDGVRCDMAMLVLNRVFAGTWGERVGTAPSPDREFWSAVRLAVPDLLLIAEAYWDLEGELQRLGFDYTYDKRLYDRLRDGQARAIAAHLGADPAYQKRLVRFLENHDEARSAATFGGDRLAAAATLVATLPGMRFYHQGQLEGKRRRVPVQLARASEEAADPACARLYEALLGLTHHGVYHQGVWRLLAVQPVGDRTSEQILAYEWRLSADWRIITVNFSARASRGRLDLPGGGTDTRTTATGLYAVDDVTQAELRLPQNEWAERGLLLELDPYQARIWSVRS